MGCGAVSEAGEASKAEDDLPRRSVAIWVGSDDMLTGRVWDGPVGALKRLYIHGPGPAFAVTAQLGLFKLDLDQNGMI